MRFANMFIVLLVSVFLLAACGSGGATQGQPSSEVRVIPTNPAEVEAPQATIAPEPTTDTEAASPRTPSTTEEPTDEPEVAALGSLKELRINLEPIVTDLDRPLYVTHAGDGSNRMFVVEKAGRIMLLRDNTPAATPFLDITERVGSRASEQGLLSVAFHPNYAQNNQLFVNYTNQMGHTVIARFEANGDTVDPGTEMVLLTIEQPYPNHNGGLVKFGPDGYLYIGMGDGGAADDPQNYAQNLNSLLGKILRLDVDNGEPYAIPADNPWINTNEAEDEIWALGVRNPWRFSFDRTNGDLYIADVGQNAFEEVHIQRASSTGGENYGWNVTEGYNCFQNATCDLDQFVPPIAEYSHDLGCSVTGGYVYRGDTFANMQGSYIFGDYCSGRMWALRETTPGTWEQAEILSSNLSISSFGEDESGELYLTGFRENTLYQVIEESDS
ncbi:MAG: glucose dehydrogenase [Chloroflexi bacterium AL-W]|nr:glucose dehydrogenase [Chloroflexi bacterium AL-N1]NOK70655.1 glucose dehydrogenase [Chloroflexi bacterium AL-N10]NOK78474.1 glucose dehydrogenase [Chloroflexi bacterium AL-N5]NOK85558.1 glucose dehydrogenase [Chloroflexi bacterium AL-W]NOK92472.1 glucose dehydrogenase [Chloroflexi bacterium AL-N15]